MRSLAAALLFAIVCAGVWWYAGWSPAAAPAAPVETRPDAARAATADGAPAELQPAGVGARSPAPAREGGEGPRRVVGRVVDETGAPIEGALAVLAAMPIGASRVQDLEHVRVQTARDGRFALTIPVGRIAVEVRCASAGRIAKGVELDPGKDRNAPLVDVGDVVLQRGIVVRGRVVDANGLPLADAAVVPREVRAGDAEESPLVRRLSAALAGALEVGLGALAGERERTGEDGRFELVLREAGTFDLQASHDRHPRASERLVVPQGTWIVDDVLLTMPPGASLRGRVVDVPGGVQLEVVARPAGGAGAGTPFLDFGPALADLPSPADRRAPLAADGSFELHGLVPDQQHEVFAVMADVSTTRCTERVRVRPPAHELELRYEPSTRLLVRVVDARTGAPVTDARVDVESTREVVVLGTTMRTQNALRAQPTRGADGSLVADVRTQEADRQLTLTVRALGYRAEVLPPVTFTGQPALDFGTVALQPACHLRVRVTDADGAPVADARVSLVVEHEERVAPEPDTGLPLAAGRSQVVESAASGANGVADLTGRPGQTGTVTVRARRFATASVELESMPEVGMVEVEVSLDRGATVVVTVVDPRGERLQGVSVSRTGPDGAKHTMQNGTDARGQVTFANVPPGAQRFALVESGSAGVRIEGLTAQEPEDAVVLQVAKGQREASVQIVRAARSAVWGVITRNGAPLEGARVTVASDQGGGGGAALGELLGRFLGKSARAVDTTGADGSYRVPEVRVGSRFLLVQHREFFVPLSVPVEVAEGGTQRDVDLRLGTLAGTVVDAAGEPVRGARVTLARDSEAGRAADLLGDGMSRSVRVETAVRTDADGRFTIPGLRVGDRVVVEASATSCYPVRSEPRTVGEATGAELRLVLHQGGTLEVTAAAGVDGSARVVAIHADEPTWRRVEVLDEGRVVLRGLRPGRWRVLRLGGAALTVTIEPGQRTAVTVR